MPKLPADSEIEVRLDSAASLFEHVLTLAQRRDLFEYPGRTVVAIMELTSVSYTGHAESEDKPPRVKLRVTAAEPAQTKQEEDALLRAKAAMWRARRMDGTLDEVGGGPRQAALLLDEDFAAYPTDAEFRRAESAKRTRDMHNAAR
ncbi:hypothetical protein VSR01_16585 [Actinacidiphila sp. DG2A-62]|uniref:hypothetical protein n=1 Tax=Actinacidiphila sp. DG2A-62 TaxID=3108821 RepID=UPI002DBB8267|nr:hypothetical protein [Actinacidiphila sp. DG2A-62]MEC3995064.1 hypothetical protein [Actinacidiphila sp. DG2A-62]